MERKQGDFFSSRMSPDSVTEARSTQVSFSHPIPNEESKHSPRLTRISHKEVAKGLLICHN